MQPIDPEDPRRPNVQIAASIRAAILNGELEPGEQLPSGEELAKFFGVTRVTIGNAIRTLRDEGFVRTKTGSGVYVRDQASLPVPGETDHPLSGVAAFLFEMGHLKRVPTVRLAAARRPAGREHRRAQLPRRPSSGWRWPRRRSADVGRTAALCTACTTRTRPGSVTYPSSAAPTSPLPPPRLSPAHQTSGMPDAAAKAFQELTAEFEASQTIEAQVARDADKTRNPAPGGRVPGPGPRHHRLAGQRSIAALRTDAAKQLAQAVTATDPQWWSAFAASYRELRASAQGRTRNLRQ